MFVPQPCSFVNRKWEVGTYVIPYEVCSFVDACAGSSVSMCRGGHAGYADSVSAPAGLCRWHWHSGWVHSVVASVYLHSDPQKYPNKKIGKLNMRA